MECPTCGKELATESGMRKHHTKVHGEALPNRTCSGCGDDFYDSKARLEYCDDCNPNAGEHNGNWSGAKETTTCLECGDAFEYYPSDKMGVYCGQCIEDSDGLLPDNPAEKMPRVTTHCPACGTEQAVRQSVIDTNEYGFFCDLDQYGLSTNHGTHTPSTTSFVSVPRVTARPKPVLFRYQVRIESNTLVPPAE